MPVTVSASYVNALLLWARTVDNGPVLLQAEFLETVQAMKDAGGTAITSTNVNGQQITANLTMSLEDKAAAYAQALNLLNGREARTTYIRF